MISVDDFRDVPILGIRDEYQMLPFGDGLCMEFGVFHGKSINTLAYRLPDRTVWGFDSFIGPPESWDKGYKVASIKSFDKSGKPPAVAQNVRLVVGYFADTLPAWWAEHGGSVAFVNIDCDIYSSAVTVLENIDSGIVPGTIIRFDELCDWSLVFEGDKKNKRPYTTWREHEWRAMTEWLERTGRRVSAFARGVKQSGTIRVEE